MVKKDSYNTPNFLNQLINFDFFLSKIYFPIILVLFLMKGGQYYYPLFRFFIELFFIIISFLLQYLKIKKGKEINISNKSSDFSIFVLLSLIILAFFAYISFFQSYM